MTSPGTWTGHETTAVAALVLSLFNFMWSVLLPWWRTRRAVLGARLELFGYQLSSGKRDEDERIVVTNHGTAIARGLTARAYNQIGADYTEVVSALWPKLPLATLHPGQTLHLKIAGRLDTTAPSRVELEWKDKRLQRQQLTVWLSYHRVG